MKTLVVGLGNPLLGDIGVGWKVAEEVKNQLPADAPVDVDFLSLGGISLMEHFIGYEHVILIDAFALEEPIGSILVLKLSDLPNYSAFHVSGAYDTPLQEAIDFGKSMGAHLPYEVEIVGIATGRIYQFSRDFSAPVVDAIPFTARIVLDLLKQTHKS